MSKTKVEKIIIIGNGFDLWQGLPTSYVDFKKYYEQNKKQFSIDLDINFIVSTNNILYTKFDLFYELINCNEIMSKDEIFWNDFESSLSLLDHDQILTAYGKENDDIYDLYNDLQDAYIIIRKLFCKWISSIKIQSNKLLYNFGNSVFINFNYTDTINKRFGVDRGNIIHIHGTAQKEESIVFGHGYKISDPELPIWAANGRMLESLIIYSLLNISYKDTNKHWCRVENYIKRNIPDINDIRDVYALGHSLGEIDLSYFFKLHKLLPRTTKWHFSYFNSKENIEQFCRAKNIVNLQIDKIETIMQEFRNSNTSDK